MGHGDDKVMQTDEYEIMKFPFSFPGGGGAYPHLMPGNPTSLVI